MLPIEQIRFWPSTVGEALWAPIEQEHSLLTKIVLCAYNIFPILAVLVTVIVGIVAFILGDLINLFHTLLINHARLIKPLFYTFHAPFPIDMDSPDASSVLRKMSRSPKVTSKTLPFIFPRAKNALGIQVTKTETWPSLNGHETNNFSERFFEGNVTIPGSDTNFWNFVRQGGTELGFSHLNTAHNIVQVIAPIPFAHEHEPDVPKLSRDLVYRIQTDPVMASKYLLSIFIYLRFFGIELGQDGEWQATTDFEARSANVRKHTHNHDKMSRILYSLAGCGFQDLAVDLHKFIKKRQVDFNLPPQEHSWASLYTYIKKHQEEFGLKSTNPPKAPPCPLSDSIMEKLQGLCQKLCIPPISDGWNSSLWDNGNYLSTLPSAGKPFPQFDTPPRWMSKEKVFQGDNALITQDPDTGRWALPHLEAPPFFCTREEQENFEASPLATETPAE